MSNTDQRILLVDNEKEFLASLQEFVESLGYQVDTAHNGQQALNKAGESGPYAVVISDQRMPEMFGTHFFGQLKEISPHTVRILITAYEDHNLIKESVNIAEVFRILKKPVGLDDLEVTLRLATQQYKNKLKTSKSYHILFIDDQPAYLHSMKKRLLKHGYEILTATNCKDALESINLHCPIAVAITDETFHVDGVSIMEIIRKRSPRTIRILFTLSKNKQQLETLVNNVGVYRVLSRLHDGNTLEESIFSALKEFDRTVGKVALSGSKSPVKPG